MPSVLLCHNDYLSMVTDWFIIIALYFFCPPSPLPLLRPIDRGAWCFNSAVDATVLWGPNGDNTRVQVTTATGWTTRFELLDVAVPKGSKQVALTYEDWNDVVAEQNTWSTGQTAPFNSLRFDDANDENNLANFVLPEPLRVFAAQAGHCTWLPPP